MTPAPRTVGAAVLGSPVDHSLSPRIHGAAYQQLGLPIDYGRYELHEAQVPEFLQDLESPLWEHYQFFSVTMPLKKAFLSAITEPSARVRQLGALNTLVIKRDNHSNRINSVVAENTDVDGIIGALDGTPHHGRWMWILGNGGTAVSAVAAAAELGAQGVTIFARDPERAHPLLKLARHMDLGATAVALHEFPEKLYEGGAPASVMSTLPRSAGVELIHALERFKASINHEIIDPRRTLEYGGTDGGPLPLLLDAVYTGVGPDAVTGSYSSLGSQLTRWWQQRGGRSFDGTVMLLHQGFEQVRLFSAALGTVIERNTDQAQDILSSMRQALVFEPEH